MFFLEKRTAKILKNNYKIIKKNKVFIVIFYKKE
jgi:hypothetical protein